VSLVEHGRQTVVSSTVGESCDWNALLGYHTFSGHLAEVLRDATHGHEHLSGRIARLEAAATLYLEMQPPSVTDKTILAASGDAHDYMSLAPFWWPDPGKPDGLPYIRKDGEVNPEYLSDEVSDARRMRDLVDAVSQMSLLYALTEDEKWAAQAVTFLETWFVNPDTRMNPHLTFGQAIRGRNTGRCFGIIETVKLCRIPLALHLLESAPSLTPETKTAIRHWFESYLEWLLFSDLGKEEGSRLNNHGTWYDYQVVVFAIFVGKCDLAKQTLSTTTARRMLSQIEEDGRQPHELARTNALGYSLMNLSGFLQLAALGQSLGIDLTAATRPEGQRLRAALGFLLPYVDQPSAWPLAQLKPIQSSQMHELVLRAMDLPGELLPNAAAIDFGGLDGLDLEHVIRFYPLIKATFH
jgi:hypothetical protein